MIKRTLYFGNPAYLKTKDEQLVINLPGANGMDEMVGNTVPIEDIGVMILDHRQITITQVLLDKLLANNVAVVTCNDKHHPTGLLLPLDVHSTQQERFEAQVNSSEPLRKQLWQQTVKAKVRNQAAVLRKNNIVSDHLIQWSNTVLSGDTGNVEARAAVYYWQHIFRHKHDPFIRDRFGDYPNNLLNYGYSILRATVARGLVGSGLLPTLGIHHRNKYNAYCLADDIMEPYRPYVDELVLALVNSHEYEPELTSDIKRQFLQIPAMDITIEGQRSPLMVGLQRTTASLAKCYLGETRKLIYPEL
jgi:CRISPR-associated protein Cas1